jgi:hypothetical protein
MEDGPAGLDSSEVAVICYITANPCPCEMVVDRRMTMILGCEVIVGYC